MHPHVDFHPLRLHGLSEAYHGHDGIGEWFASLAVLRHNHRVELSQASAVDPTRVIAAGTMTTEDPPESTSFWALDRFEAGLIIAARHQLSDHARLR